MRFRLHIVIALLSMVGTAVVWAEDAQVTATYYHGTAAHPDEQDGRMTSDLSDAIQKQIHLRCAEFYTQLRDDLTTYILSPGASNKGEVAEFTYQPTAGMPYLFVYTFSVGLSTENNGTPAHTSVSIKDEDGIEFPCQIAKEYNGQSGVNVSTTGAPFMFSPPSWDIIALDLTEYIGQTITITMLATSCGTKGCQSAVGCQLEALSAPQDCYVAHQLGDADVCFYNMEERDLDSRLAVADFSYDFIDFCHGEVQITNHSYQNTCFAKQQRPDTVVWNIDGQLRTTYDIGTLTFSPGRHTVSLHVGTANFEVDSTSEITFDIYDLQDSPMAVDTVCESALPYMWHGTPLTKTDTYYHLLTSSHGCDSIVSLHLTVIPTAYSDTTVRVGKEDVPYYWNGEPYSASGDYEERFSSAQSCDSVARLHLQVLEPLYHPDLPLNPSADCPNVTYSITDTTFVYDSLLAHPFLWFGKEYTEPGIYTDTLIGANYAACDSIGSLLLRVTYQDSLTACEGEQVTFHTPWGDYASIPDCDCIYGYPIVTEDNEWLVSISLCVQRKDCSCDTIYAEVHQQVKEEELPYSWNDFSLPIVPFNEKRDTTAVFTTPSVVTGCDSITTLFLHVLGPCELPSTFVPVWWKK